MKITHKILILIPLVALLFIWLFVYKKNPEQTVTKIKSSEGLSSRVFKPLVAIDTLSIAEPCNGLFCNGRDFYFCPYNNPSSNVFQAYHFNGSEFKKLNLSSEMFQCVSIQLIKQKLHFLLHSENNNITDVNKGLVVQINHLGKKEMYPLKLPYSYDSQIDDSCYYAILKKDSLCYLYKYNYQLNALTDSLNLNAVFNTYDRHLDMALTGRLLLLGNSLIYKSMYSCETMLINKQHLKNYRRFKSIDSIPLPHVKEVEFAGGLTQFVVEPEIYTAWQVCVINSSVAVLNDLIFDAGSKKPDSKNSVLDVYNNEFVYLTSYKLPALSSKILAYSLCYEPTRSELFVLYNDYKTIIKYQLK